MTLNQHIRATLAIGGPLIGGQLALTLISLTDTVMMGWYGVAELAAVALGASFFHVILIVGMGFGTCGHAACGCGGSSNDEGAASPPGHADGALARGFSSGSSCLPLFWFSGTILLSLGQEPSGGLRMAQTLSSGSPGSASCPRFFGPRAALASLGAGAAARGALGVARWRRALNAFRSTGC
jgi:Na+-driven multidrug efflux pump